MSMPPTFSASATCRQRTTQARARLSRRCSMCRPIPRPVICLRLGCCCGRVFERVRGNTQKKGGEWVPNFRSEERRGGEEGRTRGGPDQLKKKKKKQEV